MIQHTRNEIKSAAQLFSTPHEGNRLELVKGVLIVMSPAGSEHGRIASGTGKMRVFNNEWPTITGGNIGPEIGIGHHVGHATDAAVLILKSCIGNRALGWDLLPPDSESFESTGAKCVNWIHHGYQGSPERHQ